MPQLRSEILITKLIDNKLNSLELDELIQDINEPEKEAEYVKALKKYFDELIKKVKEDKSGS